MENLKAIRDFYKSHTCKETCEHFGLPFDNYTQKEFVKLWPKKLGLGGKRKGSGRKKDAVLTFIGNFDGWKEDFKSSAETLRTLRMNAGLSHGQVASFLGLSRSYIVGMENGTFGINRDNIYLLSCLFDVSPAIFFPPIRKVTYD